MLSALLAVGLVAERQDTPLATESAAHRTQSFFKTQKATKASVFSPSSRRSGRLPRFAPALKQPTANSASVLGKANAAAAKGLAQAHRVRPDFHEPSQICATLLGIAGFVAALIQRLIDAYPALAARLQVILARFLAAMNAILVRFGCPVPSG